MGPCFPYSLPVQGETLEETPLETLGATEPNQFEELAASNKGMGL